MWIRDGGWQNYEIMELWCYGVMAIYGHDRKPQMGAWVQAVPHNLHDLACGLWTGASRIMKLWNYGVMELWPPMATIENLKSARGSKPCLVFDMTSQVA